MRSLFDDSPEFDRDRLATRLASLAKDQIFIETSSWKYPGWVDQIYTATRYMTRGRFAKKRFEAECIREYAEVFPTVCGDFAFYQFPTSEFWANMFARVPKHFQFALKVPEQITRMRFPDMERYGSQAGQPNPCFLDAELVPTTAPRESWQQRVERVGLTFHTVDGTPYWDESVCYHFTSAEIEVLEAATEELQQLCLKAGQFIIDNDRFDELAIPMVARDAIRQTWQREPPSIYGRFDLAYDGVNPPKLLEYNANTPTGLLEAAVVQWEWHSEVFPVTDQFNSIHEKLIDKWSELKRYLRSSTVHFTCMPNDEDLMTVTYLRDVAQQAGLRTKHLFVRDIGWQRRDGTFRDVEEQAIHSIFALYPWEWLLSDSGNRIVTAINNMDWIEPVWKMLWSNKGLLAILWEMFPNHPNLLASYLDGPRGMRNFVCKPLLSREGANIGVEIDGRHLETKGPYGAGPFVYQAIAPGWSADSPTPVLGSWYVTDRGPAGIGIRESVGITTNTSRFVPHYFD